MPRYFFHIKEENGELLRDEEGIELGDLDAVHLEAVEAAREIMSDDVLKGRAPGRQAFIIEDDVGATVSEVPFTKAIDA